MNEPKTYGEWAEYLKIHEHTVRLMKRRGDLIVVEKRRIAVKGRQGVVYQHLLVFKDLLKEEYDNRS